MQIPHILWTVGTPTTSPSASPSCPRLSGLSSLSTFAPILTPATRCTPIARSYRQTQVLSNQDSGASGNLVAEVTKVLASADRARLSYLSKWLKRLRASDAQPRTIRSRRKRDRRPGWVMDAVVRVLADEGGSMRSTHVHIAVERLVGFTVSKHSVSWCLSSSVRGKEPRFERVSYGCYRLIRFT
jgi:hypothetical protein